MTAFYGVATYYLGASAGDIAFGAVSDGSTTRILPPPRSSDLDVEDLLQAMKSRLEALDSSDPEVILDSLAYNFPAEMLIGDPFDSLEEAEEGLVESLTLLDDDNPEDWVFRDVAEPITAAAASCPAPTQDVVLNLKNRQKAIDDIGYGPMNPRRPNKDFWQAKADRWNTTIEEAKTSTCGNCAAFIITPSMRECIASGIGNQPDAYDVVEAGDLGYCEALDFKCAAERTCDAWIVGGPVTEEK